MLDALLIVLCILAAAFFCAGETGLYSLNRLRLRLRAEHDETPARLLQGMVARPRLAVNAMLIGTNLAHYAVTVLFVARLAQLGLGARADLLAGLILPPVLLVLTEVLPKSFMQRHAERFMYRIAWPLRVSQAVFHPLAALLRGVVAVPHLLVGGRRGQRTAALDFDSFRRYFALGADEGVLTPFQRAVAENIMRLKSLPVAEAMTPLNSVVMISEDAGYDDLLDLMRRHRYSRIPVFRDVSERITGVIHVIDVAAARRTAGAPAMRELMREPHRLPYDTSVADALHTMRQARQPFAVAVGRDGAAAGIVTVKDLVEEIIGELKAW